MKKQWVCFEKRDEIVDFMRKYFKLTQFPITRLLSWAGILRSKFYDWLKRYGMVNEHNILITRAFWFEVWEKKAIITFYQDHRLDGY